MRKSIWLLSAGLFAIATPAAAQQTDTDQGGAQPTDGATAEAGAVAPADQAQATEDTAATVQDGGDVVVTATRRNEALSDVPLAVSAVTAEQLENTGASDIRQLQQVSPSLLVSSTQSEAGASTARIRGIGTVGDNPGLESSVALFIDGVYRSRTSVGLTELGQIERVEVLRGPQGTLFGRNASAGLISVITARPKFETQVNGELTVGNYDLRRVELGVTGPLSETLAARIDGIIVKRDGLLKDIVSGRRVNDRDRWLVRGQLLYKPTDDFSLRVIGDYTNRDEECCAAPYLPAEDFVHTGPGEAESAPSTFKQIIQALAGRTDAVQDDPFDRRVTISPGRSYRSDVKDWGFSAEAVKDFGGAELTSISAYRYNNYIRGTDVDYSILDLVYRPDDGTAFNRFKTFSEEMRLQGEAFGGKLDWLVGGYYANEKLRSRDALRYGNDYTRFANCLVAANFAQTAGNLATVLPASPTQALFAAAAGNIVNPLSPTCFNQDPTVTATNTAIFGADGAAYAAFARGAFNFGPPTGVVNFGGAPFNNSGFSNLSLISPFVPNFTSFADIGIVEDDFRQTSNNLAFFTHNIFSFTDNLKLTVGARYTMERKKLDAELTDNNTICSGFSNPNPLNTLGTLVTIPCVIPGIEGGTFLNLKGTRKENKLSGTVVLSYKPTDQLLTYLSYSRGYKAGGFNLDRSALARAIFLKPQSAPLAPFLAPGVNAGAICTTINARCTDVASADQLEFKPEINDAVELGAKYNGRGIDINVAVYQQLFKDFQLNTFNGVNFLVENVNSCKDDLNGADEDNNGVPPGTGECTGGTRAGVRSRGVEFELFARPIQNVNFNFGATYSDTKYRKNLVGVNGQPLASALFQLPGRRLSNSSLWTLTSSLAWTPPIGGSGLRGLVYVDARHQSQFNTGSDLDLEKIENGYTVFNARLGLRGPEDRWSVELWAQNLFDTDYKQVAFDALLQGSGTRRGTERGLTEGFYNRSTQLYGVFLAEPRTFGITLRGKFQPDRRVAEAAPPPPPLPQPAPVQTQTCADGSVIEATASCPLPPPPPPAPAPERG
jgi:outer membrane receptor protein involved in Fe transport